MMSRLNYATYEGKQVVILALCHTFGADTKIFDRAIIVKIENLSEDDQRTLRNIVSEVGDDHVIDHLKNYTKKEKLMSWFHYLICLGKEGNLETQVLLSDLSDVHPEQVDLAHKVSERLAKNSRLLNYANYNGKDVFILDINDGFALICHLELLPEKEANIIRNCIPKTSAPAIAVIEKHKRNKYFTDTKTWLQYLYSVEGAIERVPLDKLENVHPEQIRLTEEYYKRNPA